MPPGATEVPAFRVVTDIAAPVEVRFDLSRSIELHVESMAASAERAVAGVTSGLICAGEEVTCEARHFDIHWRVTSRITEFEPPRRFVDEMPQGAVFAHFRHQHDFVAHNRGTRMTDDRVPQPRRYAASRSRPRRSSLPPPPRRDEERDHQEDR